MDIDKDFSRETWCLLGLPFDAITLDQACAEILAAAEHRRPCFLSTPNLNFLCAAQDDPAFRQSVIHSDLSVADGFPIVLLAKWLRIPIPERVAGSDLIDRLHHRRTGTALKVFFFGGEPGAGEKASQRVNANPGGLNAVGHFAPGFGSVDDMSRPEIIADINRHDIDFLIVSLGAKKGQAWIEKNRAALKAPIISHLGAVINFFAGTVIRAPVLWQKIGLEWLWRIYQEPGLWRRYYGDGKQFLTLVVKYILPYALWIRLNPAAPQTLTLSLEADNPPTGINLIRLSGNATAANLAPLREAMKAAVVKKRDLSLDLSDVKLIDPAFLGLCLIASKHFENSGRRLRLCHANKAVSRLLAWQRMDYLLD